MKKSDAYEMGYERGFNIASWQDMPEIGQVIRSFECENFRGEITDVNDAEEVFMSFCYSAESNDREYSPFEFTASDFNKARNSESLWDEFDRGINEGIAANWNKRKSYYAEEIAA